MKKQRGNSYGLIAQGQLQMVSTKYCATSCMNSTFLNNRISQEGITLTQLDLLRNSMITSMNFLPDYILVIITEKMLSIFMKTPRSLSDAALIYNFKTQFMPRVRA